MDEIDNANEQAERLNKEAIITAMKDLNLASVDSWEQSPIYCQECGETIPEGRRKALPGTRYCVKCASKIYG